MRTSGDGDAWYPGRRGAYGRRGKHAGVAFGLGAEFAGEQLLGFGIAGDDVPGLAHVADAGDHLLELLAGGMVRGL